MLPEEQRIAMRIGINFGDIIAEEGDIFGDGVNIAARVEALAKPGSVYVSEIVHQQVAEKVDFDFEDLGPQSLKNIARPIRVYRMAGEMAELSEKLVAAATLAASPPAFDATDGAPDLPPTTINLFYDYPPLTNPNLRKGQYFANISVPLAILQSDGSETEAPTTISDPRRRRLR